MSEIQGNSQNQAPEPQNGELSNAPVDQQVNRLMEVIDRTVERYSSDPSERDLLREGVTAALRETLQDLAQPGIGAMVMGMSAAEMENLTLGADNGTIETTNGAIAAAANGAREVGTSFVSFTQGLITGTFSAIIKATIDQMKAYTEMVAELTKSLKEFAADNVSDDAVTAKLKELEFSTTSGTPAVTVVYSVAKDKPMRIAHLKRLYALAPETGGKKQEILTIFGIADLKPEQAEAVKARFDQIETGKKADGTDLDTTSEAYKDDGTGIKQVKANGTALTYDETKVSKINEIIKLSLAKDGVNQLRQMAREGMARIVVTEGEIHTKLTFSVKSDVTSNRSTSSLSKTDAGVKAEASASGGWGWGRASASVSGHYDNLQVNTVDEKTVANIQTATDMLGEVRIKFKTDYLPLNNNPEVKDLQPIA